MAFWGVEIKPAKPYSHNFDKSRGRLRISQATLGDSKSSSKSTLQCNVGNKSPVLLCSLIPNVSETCHMELEFEEDEEVIFSVLGQRSVHLTGYYTGFGCRLGGDDSDSYGEDIAASDTSGSHSYCSEDEYESDFIDDGDVGVHPDFIDDGDVDMYPVHKSSVVIEEIEDDDKQSNGNQNRRRLRKKREVSDSEDAEQSNGNQNCRRLRKIREVSDSEDAETGPKQLVVSNNGTSEVESEDEDGFPICFTVGSKSSKNKKRNEDKKRKIDGISQDTVSVSDANGNHDQAEIAYKNDENLKKKKKEKNEKHSVGSENVEKQNKQREDVNIEKKSETVANLSSGEVVGKVKESHNGAKDTGNGVINAPVTSVDPDTSKKLKRKNKKKRITEESMSDEKGSCKENKQDADEVPEENKTPIIKTSDVDVSLAPHVSGGKKKKKKNKKKNIDSDIKHEVTVDGKTGLVDGVDDSEHRSQSLQTRSFANGLIVEEVSMGKPDGKKASPGKKVSVRYIGKLKNGIIFDSNIGQRPFKFRLGIGEVIKGWDIGVKGMRLGDKRRLTIPPAFGYGTKGVGKIPPNSWLVFDVELVDVM